MSFCTTHTRSSIPCVVCNYDAQLCYFLIEAAEEWEAVAQDKKHYKNLSVAAKAKAEVLRAIAGEIQKGKHMDPSLAIRRLAKRLLVSVEPK